MSSLCSSQNLQSFDVQHPRGITMWACARATETWEGLCLCCWLVFLAFFLFTYDILEHTWNLLTRSQIKPSCQKTPSAPPRMAEEKTRSRDLGESFPCYKYYETLNSLYIILTVLYFYDSIILARVDAVASVMPLLTLPSSLLSPPIWFKWAGK